MSRKRTSGALITSSVLHLIITTCASCLLSAFVNQCLERSLMKLKDLVRA